MSETFFGFDEDDEFGAPARRHRSPWRWITAAIVLVALVGCGLLCLAGVRTVGDGPFPWHTRGRPTASGITSSGRVAPVAAISTRAVSARASGPRLIVPGMMFSCPASAAAATR